MHTAQEIVARLSEPFPPEDVYWRIGNRMKDLTRGLALAYIDARTVMNHLDRVVGPENWRDRYEVKQLCKTLFEKKTIVHDEQIILFVCTLEVRIGDEWIPKSDVAEVTDIEAGKGGCSDSFKRAAVKWGIGRYLYDLDSPWVTLIKDGKEIAPSELPRMRKLLMKPGKRALPKEPEPAAATDGITKEDRDSIVQANVEALVSYGYSTSEIEGMLATEKYAPLSYALGQLGKSKMAELQPNEVGKIKDLMGGWSAIVERKKEE